MMSRDDDVLDQRRRPRYEGWCLTMDDVEPHTVCLTFQEQDFCVFPSAGDHGPTVYVEETNDDDEHVLVGVPAPALPIDRSVFWEPLDAVFGALRVPDVLGEFLEEGTELCIAFPDLDLVLREDNVYARDISLHDISQLALGFECHGSLRMVVTEESRFISRYNELATALGSEESDEDVEVDATDATHASGEEANDAAHASGEEANDAAHASGEEATDATYAPGEEANDAAHASGEEATDATYASGEEANDAAHASGEEANDAAHASGEEANDAAHASGEEATDATYAPGEEANDAAHASGEEATDATYASGEEANDAAHASGEEATDAAHASGEEANDATYAPGEEANDAAHASGEEANVATHAPGEEANDAAHASGEEANEATHAPAEEATEATHASGEEATDATYALDEEDDNDAQDTQVDDAQDAGPGTNVAKDIAQMHDEDIDTEHADYDEPVDGEVAPTADAVHGKEATHSEQVVETAADIETAAYEQADIATYEDEPLKRSAEPSLLSSPKRPKTS